jgi:hypothetical protein
MTADGPAGDCETFSGARDIFIRTVRASSVTTRTAAQTQFLPGKTPKPRSTGWNVQLTVAERRRRPRVCFDRLGQQRHQ